jgi:Ca2+-binding RTX toxin-like protein
MRRVVLGALAVAALTVPPASFAGTASVSTTTVAYVGAAGETNHVIAAEDPPGVRILDLGAPITAGAGCAAVTANEVFCPWRERLNVAVGDLDDFVLVTMLSSRVTAQGGSGDDVLHNGRGPFTERSDFVLLIGGPGDDTLDGGGGPDRLRGGLGDDVLRGRGGFDVADYSERAATVTVDLDEVADDGEAGEADTLTGIEGVFGGSGDDRLTGSARSDSLVGGDGADTINGLGGEDSLGGGADADTLNGGGSSDFLGGGAGDDSLRGGAEFDFVDGNAGRDTLSGEVVSGGAGDDRLNGGAGGDHLGGGDGNDVLRAGGGGDRLIGGNGSDVLAAGAGRDRVVGGFGRDEMAGGLGADTLLARDGWRDQVSGGLGTDEAQIDPGRDLRTSIERLF